MDGENNGKPYEQMDDLGGKPTILGNTQINLRTKKVWKVVRDFWLGTQRAGSQSPRNLRHQKGWNTNL